MKSKSLVLTLFVLFWTIVLGLSFFDGAKSLKSFLGISRNLGYRMYAPPTTTNYDVVYTFYKGEEKLRTIKLSEYLKAEEAESIWNDKKAFVKRKLYLEPMKGFDFSYQMMVYEKGSRTQADFEKRIEQKPALRSVVNSLGNFAQLYKQEQNLEADRVLVEVERHPIVIYFKPDYKRDFTYVLGEGVFYVVEFKL